MYGFIICVSISAAYAVVCSALLPLPLGASRIGFVCGGEMGSSSRLLWDGFWQPRDPSGNPGLPPPVWPKKRFFERHGGFYASGEKLHCQRPLPGLLLPVRPLCKEPSRLWRCGSAGNYDSYVPPLRIPQIIWFYKCNMLLPSVLLAAPCLKWVHWCHNWVHCSLQTSCRPQTLGWPGLLCLTHSFCSSMADHTASEWVQLHHPWPQSQHGLRGAAQSPQQGRSRTFQPRSAGPHPGLWYR